MNHASLSSDGPATMSTIGWRAFSLVATLLVILIHATPGHADSKQVTLPCQPGNPSIKLSHNEESVRIDMANCYCARDPGALKKRLHDAASKGSFPSASASFSSTLTHGQQATLTFYCITKDQFGAYEDVVRPPPPRDPAEGGFDPTDTDAAAGGAF